ncbi:hypothetical protein [Nostoc sp. CMAA1605]|uniref:hypothetical protein n=1 Tax=Nostoc sp. CMAA1605 TaxID=2055159 RepID=UPI001F177D24|nr:hypothetical protein [Nostoc sp. CMAA1605]
MIARKVHVGIEIREWGLGTGDKVEFISALALITYYLLLITQHSLLSTHYSALTTYSNHYVV